MMTRLTQQICYLNKNQSKQKRNWKEDIKLQKNALRKSDMNKKGKT